MHVILILWIGLCAWLEASGWLLSSLHQLNAVGYGIALAPVVLAALVFLRKQRLDSSLGKYTRRFRHPVSAIFIFLTLLVFLGGILHAPSNFDALTYRFPRMLHWLSAERWHWIATPNQRLNYSNTGWEWLTTPLLCLTRSDRFLFLIDAISFILMPGLCFSLFRRLGVAHRTAWWWMWIAPFMYGCATQAASVGNDLTGTVFLLSALYFGLRSRKSGRVSDVWLAILATALMTSVKMSNLPLGLPCVIAMFPGVLLLRRHLPATVLVLGLAVMASAVPIMALNQRFAGSWTGDPGNKYQMQVKNPLTALIGNGLLLAEQSLLPPVLPHSKEIREYYTHHFPEPLTRMLWKDFPRYYGGELTELPGEEGAGLGLGVTLAIFISGVAAVLCIGKRFLPLGNKFGFPLVIWGGWVAFLFYMAKMGSEAAPRLLLPYYPLIIATFLVLPVQQTLMTSRFWKAFLLLVPLFILPTILISPSRPILPMTFICGRLEQSLPGNSLLRRMSAVYTTYSHRNDLLAAIRPHIPEDVRELGFLAGSNDTDYSVWKPYGSRRIKYLNEDEATILPHHSGVEWAVIKEIAWKSTTTKPLAEWLHEEGGEIVFSETISEVVIWGPEKWYLVRFPKGK